MNKHSENTKPDTCDNNGLVVVFIDEFGCLVEEKTSLFFIKKQS